MIGVGAAAAVLARSREAFPPRLLGVSSGIACGPDRMEALGATGALVDAAEDAVEGVTNGPVSSEQPLAQPVAAGPTNVGAAGPMLLALAAWARSLALAVAADAKATSITAANAGITHRSVTRRFQDSTDVRICVLPSIGPPTRAGCSGPWTNLIPRVAVRQVLNRRGRQ
jgi:hypothetical protein